jgi:hypothetical protein
VPFALPLVPSKALLLIKLLQRTTEACERDMMAPIPEFGFEFGNCFGLCRETVGD